MKKSELTINNYIDAKAIIAGDPEMGASKIDYRSEIGQPILITVILDISRSMREFHDEIIDCCNNIMIPSLKKLDDRYKNPLRLKCLLFSEKIALTWKGYKSLKEIGPKPFKRIMLEQDGLQGRTALYGAMKTGVIWTAAAMEHMRKNGRGEIPKGKIIVLTDGANNEAPDEESAVLQASDGITRKNSIKPMIGFLNTNYGLTENEFLKMATATGFTSLGFSEIPRNRSLQEKRELFRRHFQKIFAY